MSSSLPTSPRSWPLTTTINEALLKLRCLLSRIAGMMPGTCALCASTGAHTVCQACRTQFFAETTLRCHCCALPLTTIDGESAHCLACRANPPAFDATVVATTYGAPIDQLVLKLKFGASLPLAPLFAELILEALLRKAAPELPLPDCLTMVPLGQGRLRERGFNQSLEIARPLASALGVPLAPRMLARTRETVAQSRLSSLERQRNLRGAFTLLPQTVARVCGAHIGVVDDVMTTGQTLNEVATTLKFFGAARVTNFVFARTL